MARSLALLAPLFLSFVNAQSPAARADVYPMMKTWKCTKAGGCKEQTTALVMDSSAHSVHQVNNPRAGCGDWGAGPNATVCPDKATCQKNCVMEAITDYSQRGITVKDDVLNMRQLRPDGNVVSPRVYLLSQDKSKYEMLNLAGGEFTFDVDVSKLPCGMNGALYLSEMEADGGRSKEPLNTGGSAWGTGYCDAQCFTTPFINGVANIEAKGSCCNEMDIFEANSRSQQIAPHTCNKTGLYKCTGDECAFEGVCDKNGCGFNTYRHNNAKFYGRGLAVDTTKPFTVVTQFPTNMDGDLESIHRFYIQNGKIIKTPVVNIAGFRPAIDFINDAYCNATNSRKYMGLGATKEMGESLKRGMVLIFSIWWDESGFMKWLDAEEAGPCNATEGNPTYIRQIQPDTDVTWSKVKWGEINSTWSVPAALGEEL